MAAAGPSLFHGMDRNGPEHLTISRNGTDGTDCTLKKAKGLCVRLTVLQRCAREHEVSSEEFNNSNCLSCT